ncbi:hypothetical protein [Nesterenkonia populi]|uniref:hypothetical protein n=1 Tax=Nesterenkonia populi TaxID=1591087 RepID=UPI0011BE3BC5|nr:hypothetical protein [Nesterenkonia populi]
MAKKLRYTIANRPAFDQVLPLLSLFAWILWGDDWLPEDITVRHGIYTGVATLAGLALASATFSCTMTYQSADPLLKDMRAQHHKVLKRNWTAIILSCLFCAVIPILSIFVDEYRPYWAFGVVIYAASLLITRFGRSVYWLRNSLFIVDHSDQVVPADAPQMKRRD